MDFRYCAEVLEDNQIYVDWDFVEYAIEYKKSHPLPQNPKTSKSKYGDWQYIVKNKAKILKLYPTCAYSAIPLSVKTTQVDHIVAQNHEWLFPELNLHHPDNLWLLHRTVNTSKDDKMAIDFCDELEFLEYLGTPDELECEIKSRALVSRRFRRRA